MGRRSLSFAAVALAAAVLAGSASPAPRAQRTDTKVWVTRVCTSLKTWQHTLQRRANAVSKVNPTSVAKLHDAFAGFLGAVVKDTDKLIAQTKAAGTPSASHGKDVSNALIVGFKKLRAYFAADAKKAQHLSRTNAQQFAAGASALGNAIDKQASQIGKTFDNLAMRFKSPEIDKAMKSAPACKGVS